MTIYVFTGPTLSPPEARAELDAIVLPPVAQGDVHRIGLLRPCAIGIVDGYFECVPAVWHKEILWAMAQGIHVFGAASMGALRAAELGEFGMVGVGKVFEAFRDGILEDDDEVAVVHATEEHGYRAASEAMVNIRCTLGHAELSKVISRETRVGLEAAAKALYYPDRSYPRVLAEGARQGLAAGELEALRGWLPGGRIDQKRADALEMLRALRRHREKNPEPMQVSFVLEHTKFWDRAVQSAAVAADRADGRVAMVPSANLLEELRLDPRQYGRVRREALLQHLIVAEARRRGFVASAEETDRGVEEFRAEHGLATDEAFHAWLAANHLDAAHFSALIQERVLVRLVLPRLREEAASRLLDLLRMGGQYRHLVARSAEKARALEQAAVSALAPADERPADELLLEWFLERLGPPDEHNVEGQAAVLEFAHGNLNTFLDALAREYRYRALQ